MAEAENSGAVMLGPAPSICNLSVSCDLRAAVV